MLASAHPPFTVLGIYRPSTRRELGSVYIMHKGRQQTNSGWLIYPHVTLQMKQNLICLLPIPFVSLFISLSQMIQVLETTAFMMSDNFLFFREEGRGGS